jgi:hypothetical protein
MSDTDTTLLPASKDAYSFDDTTREYLGIVEVFLSPLEAAYFLPRNVVAIAPPAHLGSHERARLSVDGTAWEVVPDFRRVMLWDTTTCTPVANTLALGDALPANVTAEPPPILRSEMPLTNVWDDDVRTWRQLPDYSRTPLWSKATGQRAVALAPCEPLPDTLTTRPPPVTGAHQALQWNALHDGWDLVTDYRGVTYWDAEGAPHVITELGIEPPADARFTPPDTDAIPFTPSEA